MRKAMEGNGPYEIFLGRVEPGQIHINDSMKDQLEGIIAYILNPEPHGEDSRENGVIFKGLPGSGKGYTTRYIRTLVSDILGKEVPLFVVGAIDDPKQVIQVYQDARIEAAKSGFVIVFHDEVDRYGKRKDMQDPVKHAILNQLLIELDGGMKSNKGVLSICATNLEDDLDPAFRRGKRCGTEVYFEPLDKEGRKHVMDIEAHHKDHGFVYEQDDLDGLVDKTFGYVGADVSQLFVDAGKRANLCLQRSLEAIAENINYKYEKKDAGKLAGELKELPLVNLTADLDKYAGTLIEGGIEARKLEEEGVARMIRNMKLANQMVKYLNPNSKDGKKQPSDDEQKKDVVRWLRVSRDHLDYALEKRVPSALKDMPWEETDLKLADFVGYQNQEGLIRKIIENGMLNPDDGKGSVLYFYGKDGNGVTSYARAVAGEYGFNLIVVHGADPESKWVGDTKDKVNTIIERARASAPTVVVFDNLKYLVSAENDVYRHKESQTGALRARLKPTPGVLFIATGETLDEMNPSIRGRFKYTFKFEKPADEDNDTRKGIWQLYLDQDQMSQSDDVNLEELAKASAGLSGGDIKDVCERMHQFGIPYRQGSFVKLLDFYKTEKLREMDDASRYGKIRIILEADLPPDEIGRPPDGGRPISEG